ncbi:integral membrane sensor signal transduction histidine kinase [Chthoniobacter flavus Ellin428]|uniref:histidine kinase n=1 Tax=Chthoniobacter flavus Ellin428 TaxID=497964 RepID=B4CX53_9BACT|nr:two-component regulator propeller domain-containing protein [Chthoniobacter flavus]EDY20851.1 integral membrane sensor signal transduction histidine kinase [Chthoniobacter flavus Ellin428]TCO85657.1 two component regulator with propeller domain [Chthoniobacter flavus]
MKQVFIIGFLAVIAFLATGSWAGAEVTPALRSEWVTQSWQTEDGLPQNTVNAILQTRDGFLWVGTSAGLARFDGVRFRKFGLTDGLRSVRISTLAEDKQGGLWIGTTGGGVSRRMGGRFDSFGSTEGFPSNADVVSMTSDRDGSIWIGTSEGLVKWHDGVFTVIGEAQGLPHEQIRALTQDSNGSLWVSVLPGGVFRSEGGHFTLVKGSGVFPDYLYSLATGVDGVVWGGAGNGLLWRWQGGEWKRFDRTNGLPLASFMSLAVDSAGTLWICADDHGLYRSRAEQFEPVAGKGELSDPFAGVVAADCEGCIWVGTRNGGLNRLSRRELYYWGANAGWDQAPVMSIAQDGAGALWIGAGSKGIYHLEGGQFSRLQDSGVSAQTHRTYCTASAPDGSIWAAGESCLYHFQSGQPTRAFLDSPIRGEAIRALCADKTTLWMGTYYSTLLKCDGTTVQVAAPRGSFGGDITSIVSEEADTIWIGSAGGLHRWRQGHIVRTWGTQDGLLTANVLALLRDPDGTMWIGTRGGGLARLKDGRIFNVTSQQGLVDDVISQIVADDMDHLWLGCNRGLMRLERKEIDALASGKLSELHPLCFGRNEGMVKEQCTGGHSPTVCKTKDGRLLFPTVTGIAEIDPAQLQNRKPVSPQASIDGVQIDGQDRAPGAALVVPPGYHRLDLHFTAPVLGDGNWGQFRYRLDGLDRDWITDDRDRLASYDGLRPGHYVFRVEASGNGGKWSEPGVALALTVQPFLVQRLGFQVTVVALFIFIGAALVWWSMHRRHLRQIAEIERARLQDAELARVGRVSLLGELSASLAHELSQPLAAILSNAQAALRFLEDEPADVAETRACLRDIAASDQRASEIIRHMRSMMKKGEAQLEPRDINLDIEGVLALLHSDLVTRQVVVTTELQPDLPSVRGDHIQLQQVLLNLIVNSGDAMRSADPEARSIVVSTRRDGAGLVRVSVADSGPGIEPDKLERIFDPFYSTKSNGLGMGLSICRAIIKAHGGHLWAESELGRGATFHFTLLIGSEHPVSEESRSIAEN